MTISDTTPIFRIFDEARAKAFYVDFLGFSVAWEHRFEDGLPLYLEITRDNVRLHLTEHHGDCCPGAAVRIGTDNLRALHDELSVKDYEFARPEIVDTPWGIQEMSIKDPFGNRVTFVAIDRD
ncbi:MAG: glyoxalase superfamily protein [Woeseiaceae bacterium]